MKSRVLYLAQLTMELIWFAEVLRDILRMDKNWKSAQIFLQLQQMVTLFPNAVFSPTLSTSFPRLGKVLRTVRWFCFIWNYTFVRRLQVGVPYKPPSEWKYMAHFSLPAFRKPHITRTFIKIAEEKETAACNLKHVEVALVTPIPCCQQKQGL